MPIKADHNRTQRFMREIISQPRPNRDGPLNPNLNRVGEAGSSNRWKRKSCRMGEELRYVPQTAESVRQTCSRTERWTNPVTASVSSHGCQPIGDQWIKQPANKAAAFVVAPSTRNLTGCGISPPRRVKQTGGH